MSRTLVPTETPRTPLWAMTDEQLRAYVEDDLIEWHRRQTARMILLERLPEQEQVPGELPAKVVHHRGGSRRNG